MSYGDEPPGVGEETNSRLNFELALRGYDKRQVDQHLAHLDGEMATLAAERDRARGEIKDLTAQLRKFHAELSELRQQPAQIDRATFRDLGPMVDQMLALAEKQAGELVGTATQRAAKREAEADKLLGDAREQAAQVLRGLDAQLAARRQSADRAHEERRAAAEAELAQIRELANKVQADGETARAQAEQDAQRIQKENAQQVESARAEAAAMLEAAGSQAEQELAHGRAELEREVGARRTEAAQKIAMLHGQAQQQADDLRRSMNEQTAAHQQQLAILQEEIQAQRQTLTMLQSEIDSADQGLEQAGKKRAEMDHEAALLQDRLRQMGEALTAEHHRLNEARHAGEAAEQHAKDVRARVQREAKRVAEMAAAAVMAAAAGGTNTGEFPRVVLAPGAGRTADGVAKPQQPHHVPNSGPPSSDRGHDRHDTDRAVPAQRGPQPAKLAADAE